MLSEELIRRSVKKARIRCVVINIDAFAIHQEHEIRYRAQNCPVPGFTCEQGSFTTLQLNSRMYVFQLPWQLIQISRSLYQIARCATLETFTCELFVLFNARY